MHSCRVDRSIELMALMPTRRLRKNACGPVKSRSSTCTTSYLCQNYKNCRQALWSDVLDATKIVVLFFYIKTVDSSPKQLQCRANEDLRSLVR